CARGYSGGWSPVWYLDVW
nr:immunoglobulin heavy chain junction region [Macaca mulatta]MOV57875.1 immunoglobulin heavy chain junction region [Macaca mulatta]MOV58007.1 immunoglobulin heavy chain junction region [Macaca mulatta]MOV60412.1 immunoglobulin heavy chain junction region [Macaca mulatta]